MTSEQTTTALIEAARELRDTLRPLKFAEPITHVYCPLEYAWASQEMYLRKFGSSKKKVVLLGMNPGPFGMAQTGVPFGEIAAVRDWMGIHAQVGRPYNEHPKRLVTGFEHHVARVALLRQPQRAAQAQHQAAACVLQPLRPAAL